MPSNRADASGVDLAHVRFEGRLPTRECLRRRKAVAGGSRDMHSARCPAPAPSSLPGIVLARHGLDPAAYRGSPLERRMNACLRVLRAEDEHGAASRLAARPDLLGPALSTLLIGVTEFFRDAPVFETLRQRAIPELRACPAPLRVWSLGCANGAELYSVAILLAEAGVLERTELLGTDCRPDAITAAAAGAFREEELAGVAPALRARYFDRTRSGWRAAAALRERIAWRQADNTLETPAGPWHLVLCRNVVIYLQPAVTEEIFRRIAAELARSSFVVVGKAERPPRSLPLVAVDRCVYRHVR